MDRTVRAALVAGVSVALTIGVLGPFLGFPTTPAIVTAVVLGVLAALLLWGAGRRAETFHPTDPTAHLADHRRPLTDGDAAAPTDPSAVTDDDRATDRSSTDHRDDPTAGA